MCLLSICGVVVASSWSRSCDSIHWRMLCFIWAVIGFGPESCRCNGWWLCTKSTSSFLSSLLMTNVLSSPIFTIQSSSFFFTRNWLGPDECRWCVELLPLPNSPLKRPIPPALLMPLIYISKPMAERDEWRCCCDRSKKLFVSILSTSLIRDGALIYSISVFVREDVRGGGCGLSGRLFSRLTETVAGGGCVFDCDCDCCRVNVFRRSACECFDCCVSLATAVELTTCSMGIIGTLCEISYSAPLISW